ncbi:hypothetical protein C8A03DRAFT_38270 [Achaetomium macrosporum]|uniref:Uncharacterized protein n=1 Tax=Achaetomium macrosporum TaxID=79813 RepID=A0AAN7C256_9PEZI|nr:hypothetical protein C8A03DRAFT_38270 [Achaetomium macrosporum]
MQFTKLIALTFAALATASPLLEERQCVGNLQRCNKRASAVLGRQCCGGLYCCGVIGSNNVCQTVNNCGE